MKSPTTLLLISALCACGDDDGGTDAGDCGDELQCVLDSEVCNVTLGGIGGMTYACSPLPDECGGEPSCDCIPAGPGTCSGDAETGITVTIATP